MNETKYHLSILIESIEEKVIKPYSVLSGTSYKETHKGVQSYDNFMDLVLINFV